MKKFYRKLCAVMLLGLFCVLFAGCGCGKKKPQETEQVVKITITPVATPTPAPEEVNAEAVVTSGKVTMVNDYLVEKGSSGETPEATETPAPEQEDENDTEEE